MKILKDFFLDFKNIIGNDGGWWIPLAMAAYGAVKGKQDEAQAKRMNKAAATQTEFSPWTKMGQGQLQAPNSTMLSGAATGAVSGMGMQQSMNAANAANATNKQGIGNTLSEQFKEYGEQGNPIMVDATRGVNSANSQQLARPMSNNKPWGRFNSQLFGA